MLIDFLIVYGPVIQVVAIVLGILAAVSFFIWVIIGVVLWFVRGTHDSEVETVESEWFDE